MVINNQFYFCWHLNKYSDNYKLAKCFWKGKYTQEQSPTLITSSIQKSSFIVPMLFRAGKKNVCKTHILFDFTSINFYIKLKFVDSTLPADNNDTCPQHPHNWSMLENGSLPIEKSPCTNSPQSSSKWLGWSVHGNTARMNSKSLLEQLWTTQVLVLSWEKWFRSFQ